MLLFLMIGILECYGSKYRDICKVSLYSNHGGGGAAVVIAAV